jgi:hypothetical protein
VAKKKKPLLLRRKLLLLPLKRLLLLPPPLPLLARWLLPLLPPMQAVRWLLPLLPKSNFAFIMLEAGRETGFFYCLPRKHLMRSVPSCKTDSGRV